MRTERSGPDPLSRRSLLRAASGMAATAGALTLSGCGGGNGADPTPEPTPSPTAPVVVTPTSVPALIATPLAAYQDPERWRGRTLTVATPGGAYQEAQASAYFTPFQEATGARLSVEVVDIGRLREQVDNEETVWDACCVPTEDVIQLGRDGYLTPIDYGVVDATALFADRDIAMQHGVVVDLYATTMAYGAGSAEVPGTWADFWETSRFGGLRALRRTPVGTLEFALLADGVAFADLYPLDTDRAFASLERIFPDVLAWYEDAQQPVQLVLSGEVGLAAAWNVRILAPDIAGRVLAQWTGGMLSGDSWTVPTGAANADVAMDFINYATRSVPQANFCNILPFGPVNPRALPLLPPERLSVIPTSDALRDLQFTENWAYWTDQREVLTERFEAWLVRDRSGSTPPATPAAIRR
ncbi:MAG: hypothetical protein AVDCRST_MAG33-485 [uncultured Thermomicrobiales bacterium]|uniref:ABC transporter, periplasmic spermidine putrescine-binding protein PotD n=1 Tax=uncultured Thermomicrobiales bacterium TaxID=1645740 RepID=A0A6J4UEV9_9BACT|nr:MAG: hypothetical protein AVDCRST_MAG33-485 [uncultured Thermomicrobiales bacterium]